MINKLKGILLAKSPAIKLQMYSLNGVRGVAIIFFLFSHLGNAGLDFLPSPSFSGIGKYGVYLCFVLRLFLLTSQLIEKQNIFKIEIWRRYAVERLFRIFPFYFFIVIISYAFSHRGFFIPLSNSDVLTRLTLRERKNVFWSIPVEFKYPLALPVVTSIISVQKCLSINIIPFTVIFFAVSNRTLWPFHQKPKNTILLGPYLPVLIIGSCIALLQFKIEERNFFKTIRSKVLLKDRGLQSSTH